VRDSFFRININRIHHDKHGSDSMSYDNQGRFRPHAFEEFFDNYDRGNKGGLNMGDIYYAWLGQRLVFDFFGWSAMFFECEWFRKHKKIVLIPILTLRRACDVPATVA